MVVDSLLSAKRTQRRQSSYEVPKQPLFEVAEMQTADMQFEPATVSAAIAVKMVGRVITEEIDVIAFNVFKGKFIGILEVYFNGCGIWRFTECKNQGSRQVVIMSDLSLPKMYSGDIKQLLIDIALLVYRVHLSNNKEKESEWQEGWKRLEYIDTTELKEFIEANQPKAV